MSDPDLAQRATPDDPALRTPTWGLGDAAIGFLLGLTGSVLAVSLVVAITGDDTDDLSLAWLNVAQIGLWLPLLGIALWAAALKGNGAVRDFGLRMLPWDLPLGAVVGVLCQFVLLPLVYVPILWITNTDTEKLNDVAQELTDRADNGFGIAMLVILTGIGAPIVEEIFYRGLVLRSLERRWGPTPAILVSGLLFGAVHFQLLQLPGLAVFGVVLAWLTIRTGRLGPAIAAHMAFNLVTVVALVADN